MVAAEGAVVMTPRREQAFRRRCRWGCDGAGVWTALWECVVGWKTKKGGLQSTLSMKLRHPRPCGREGAVAVTPWRGQAFQLRYSGT
jgi:hypothetical protein